MNTRNENEAKAFMKTLWPSVDNISVRQRKNFMSVELEYSSSVGISFDRLLKMVEFFGTDRIDIDSSFSQGGCPTCSYGDEHTLTFTIRPKESV